MDLHAAQHYVLRSLIMENATVYKMITYFWYGNWKRHWTCVYAKCGTNVHYYSI